MQGQILTNLELAKATALCGQNAAGCGQPRILSGTDRANLQVTRRLQIQRSGHVGIKTLGCLYIERCSSANRQTDHFTGIIAVEHHITRCIGQRQRGSLLGTECTGLEVCQINQQRISQLTNITGNLHSDMTPGQVRLGRTHRGTRRRTQRRQLDRVQQFILGPDRVTGKRLDLRCRCRVGKQRVITLECALRPPVARNIIAEEGFQLGKAFAGKLLHLRISQPGDTQLQLSQWPHERQIAGIKHKLRAADAAQRL